MKPKQAVVAFAVASLMCFSSVSCSSDVYGCGGDLTTILKTKQLVVGTEAGYKPFEYLDVSTNAIEGFDVDFMNLVGEKINATYDTDVKVVFKDMDFDGLIGSLEAKQIDLIAAAFSITADREKSVLFSDPYFVAQTVVVTKSDNTSITDMDSLKTAVLGAQLGTVQDGYITADGFNSKNETLKSISDLILALQAGQIDALVVEEPVAQSIVAAQSGLKIIDTIQFDDDGGYGIASNYTIGADLIGIVNSVITEAKANGTLDQMYIDAANAAAASD